MFNGWHVSIGEGVQLLDKLTKSAHAYNASINGFNIELRAGTVRRSLQTRQIAFS
jgi:hypothetical protein